jgi:hypothetical protein
MGGNRAGGSRHLCIRRQCSLNLYIHLRIASLNILSRIISLTIHSNILNNILSNTHNNTRNLSPNTSTDNRCQWNILPEEPILPAINLYLSPLPDILRNHLVILTNNPKQDQVDTDHGMVISNKDRDMAI